MNGDGRAGYERELDKIRPLLPATVRRSTRRPFTIIVEFYQEGAFGQSGIRSRSRTLPWLSSKSRVKVLVWQMRSPNPQFLHRTVRLPSEPIVP